MLIDCEAAASINTTDDNTFTPTEEPPLSSKDESLVLAETEVLPDVSLGPGLNSPHRLDMSDMRLDVAKISADIQGGEELYRRALNRVEGLMGFVEKAEVDFSVLNRLEPENRRLKAKLRTANGDVETIKGKLSPSATLSQLIVRIQPSASRALKTKCSVKKSVNCRLRLPTVSKSS